MNSPIIAVHPQELNQISKHATHEIRFEPDNDAFVCNECNETLIRLYTKDND